MVKAVPHRHVVLSIPKILRRYFLYGRRLLSDLNRCGWEALKVFYTTGVRDEKVVSGAVEWLAAMCSHVPGKGEQMVRYYRYYSNVARVKRKKAVADDHIPC
ncbi:MAG TPA: hypothetical protein QF571_06530, partial [Desulfobacterales bacterium]|nr:hypothetical protein [Desulfobacterales bacterium]